MAEGFGHQLLRDKYIVSSAGTKKSELNPYAVKVMAEVGIDITSQFSKTTDELENQNIDIVITVCDDAHENCPYFPGGRIIHQGFDDPPRLAAKLEGASEEEILSPYRRVRDEIREMIKNFEQVVR